MREFEERLTREKEEIRQKAEEERQQIENAANLKEEERNRLLEELKAQEAREMANDIEADTSTNRQNRLSSTVNVELLHLLGHF